MRVFVINKNKQPLMPTIPSKAKKLLKQNKAKVIKRNPFTIQLLYTTGETKQNIELNIDSGYLNIGFSAMTNKEELIAGEIKLLNGMVERNKERSMYRKNRRSRLRYRPARWNNRKKKEGWLAPSLQHKLDSHIRFIDNLHHLLPITKIIIEVANFDIQKIKNPEITNIEYQQGEQLGFWNVREYILHRDNHKCQNPNCKSKDKNPILEIHHIVYRSDGGTNAPNNLITLCNKCHTSQNHKGFLKSWKPKIRSFKDATFMSTIRWMLINQLKEKYNNVNITYGYLTKNNRINLKIEKTHANDAFSISGTKKHKRTNKIYNIIQVKRNNRSLETFKDAKYIDVRNGEIKNASELNCGRTTRNKNKNGENLRKYRGEKIRDGKRSIRKQRYFLQSMDLVKYEEKLYYVKGVQNKGKYINLKNLKKVPNIEKVKLINYGKGFCWMI